MPISATGMLSSSSVCQGVFSINQAALLHLKIARQSVRREVWLFQMNDEQRSMALFQVQPEGPDLFSRPAALSFAYVDQLHGTHSALLTKKIGSGSTDWLIENTP